MSNDVEKELSDSEIEKLQKITSLELKKIINFSDSKLKKFKPLNDNQLKRIKKLANTPISNLIRDYQNYNPMDLRLLIEIVDSIRFNEFRNDLVDCIQKSSKVFIIGHNSPDFDAIGSAMGLYALAVQSDKKVYIVIDDDETKIEPGVKKIVDDNRDVIRIITKDKALEKLDSSSLLIVTDTNKKNLISLGDSLDLFKKVIVIDHHGEGEDSIVTPLKYINLSSSSASEIVSRILNKEKVKYSGRLANYLLAGISLDTQRFKKNTTSLTHDVAEKLINHGADIDTVNRLFLQDIDEYCRISKLIIYGTDILQYTDSLSPTTVSFTLNRRKPTTVYLKEDYAKTADRMLKFNGIDASFVLGYVDDEYVHISARGNKKVNVGKIMEAMSGGGNLQSAGAKIKADDILTIEEELRKKVALGVSDSENLIEKPLLLKKVRF